MLAPALHHLAAAVTSMRAELAAVAETPTFGLGDGELSHAQVEAHRLAAQVAELELRLAAEAASRNVDVKTVWVRETHQTPRQAAARMSLAQLLDSDVHQPVRSAMATGEVAEPQARVIVRAIESLPDDLDPVLVAQAQEHLLGLCVDHHPDELRRLGRHLLRTVAPEVAEAREAAQVDAEYRLAIEACRLTLLDRHDGTWEGRFVLPAAYGHALKKMLLALAAPKHRTALGVTWKIETPTRQRLGEAFCELIERYPTQQIAKAGGLSARVLVDISLDDLTVRLHDHGVALVDQTVPLPAWEARRLACEAGILPAVLGGDSEILDLGRSRRLHNEPQRVVISKRDVTCRTEGCDWPAAMGHIHHVQPWSRGGSTNLTNAMALCPRHHRRAHDPTYAMSTSKNGRVIFRRT